MQKRQPIARLMSFVQLPSYLLATEFAQFSGYVKLPMIKGINFDYGKWELEMFVGKTLL